MLILLDNSVTKQDQFYEIMRNFVMIPCISSISTSISIWGVASSSYFNFVCQANIIAIIVHNRKQLLF